MYFGHPEALWQPGAWWRRAGLPTRPLKFALKHPGGPAKCLGVPFGPLRTGSSGWQDQLTNRHEDTLLAPKSWQDTVPTEPGDEKTYLADTIYPDLKRQSINVDALPLTESAISSPRPPTAVDRGHHTGVAGNTRRRQAANE